MDRSPSRTLSAKELMKDIPEPGRAPEPLGGEELTWERMVEEDPELGRLEREIRRLNSGDHHFFCTDSLVDTEKPLASECRESSMGWTGHQVRYQSSPH